jgi:hypothetical protein
MQIRFQGFTRIVGATAEAVNERVRTESSRHAISLTNSAGPVGDRFEGRVLYGKDARNVLRWLNIRSAAKATSEEADKAVVDGLTQTYKGNLPKGLEDLANLTFHYWRVVAPNRKVRTIDLDGEGT